MGNRKREGHRRFQNFLIVSLLVHLLFIWFVVSGPNVFEVAQSDRLKPLQIILVESPKPEKQIVEFDKRSDQSPEDARFLAKHDFKVDKETVAKAQPSVLMPMTEQEIKKLLRKPTPQKGAKGLGQKSPLAKYFPTDVFEQKVAQESPKRSKKSSLADQVVDRLEKVEVGETTMLNTHEFKFYSYFSRMRLMVHRVWIDRIQGVAFKSWMTGRQLASDVTHETQLVIVLDGEGKILDIIVQKSCGVDALDKASIESFLESGPFPNPPKDLLQNEKHFKITWSFFVNVT